MIRDTLSLDKRRGFTIIELVVVIAVIGIIASITIVGYGAWKKQTLITQVKSDLSAVAGAMESARNFDNKYPSSVPSTVKSSDAVDFVGGGSADGSKYCVSKVSAEDPTIEYYITSKTKDTGAQEGSCPVPVNNNGVVTTLAGSTGGYLDAVGTAAQFNYPYALAVNSSGDIYVADTYNNRIRKIASDGNVMTIAGSTYGYAEGTGAGAQFKQPGGIAVDASGNVYVTDTYNNRIRKVTADGTVSTIAGSTSGYADGVGSAAQFSSPMGLAIDGSGNLYVGDTYNNRIRKITPDGTVSTIAGSTSGYADGVGAGAQFKLPQGVAVDTSGNLYVADSSNNRIRKITPAGQVTTLAGSASGNVDGVGSVALFNRPMGVAVDAFDIVYVADTYNNLIRKVLSDGTVTTLAGSASGYADGTGTAAMFNAPFSVAVSSSGAVYVSDINNHRIRKIQ